MSHTLRQKEKLLARVRRIRGQMEGIERALEGGSACGEVLRQLASARGAMAGLSAELMADHLQEHVVDAATDAERRAGSQELLEVIRTYMK